MKPDLISESLSKLDEKYQILTELHHCGETRTYLARDLERNRDVTITVARAGGSKAFLNAYAADAETLKTKRHPNVVPVLEGMWLDDSTFAAVRTRVRGSTLDQTAGAVGAMPPARISAALSELTTALIWARDVGITNRCIEPETFVFQQGSGRILIGFEPSPYIASDAETIAAFGRMMNGDAYLDVSQYTARLGALPVTSTPAAAAAKNPTVMTDKQVSVPVGSDGAVVERPNRGMSFMARVLTTFGVVGALVVGGIVFMHHRNAEARLQANAQQSSNESNAAGDVALHSAPDTAAAYAEAYPSSQIVGAAPAAAPPNLDSIGRENEKRIADAKEQARVMASTYGTPYGATASASPSPYPSPYPTSTSTSTSPTSTRRTTIDTSMSSSSALPPRPAVDSLGRTELLDPCGSPIGSDQSQCVNTAIEKADRSISGVYQRLTDALRRQAAVTAGDPDPTSVEDLRSAQHRWQLDREDACRQAGTGSFYAKDRAACYADRTTDRKAELQRQLDAIPN
ncbi:MAG TPA: lysozyme inhibitor LprI family protein [Gemmatimonadaceae bacterium]|jgi:uncharacterized protein YecT (DUF1311 family)